MEEMGFEMVLNIKDFKQLCIITTGIL